jgi:hypothetical protein
VRDDFFSSPVRRWRESIGESFGLEALGNDLFSSPVRSERESVLASKSPRDWRLWNTISHAYLTCEEVKGVCAGLEEPMG